MAADTRLTAREIAAALVAGGLVAALSFAFFLERLPGDGSGLINLLARSDTNGGPFTFWYHIGYAWLVSCIRAITPFLTVRGTLELVSALGAGAAVSLAYLAPRRLGLSAKSAGLAALLLALTPAMAEHTLTVEVHTVQLAAGLLGLFLMARAARASLARLFAISLSAGLIVAFAHQTGPLLFPGLVLASFWSDEDKREPAPLRLLAIRFATSAAAFTLAILAAREATARFSPFEKIKQLSDFTSLTASLTKGISIGFVRDELLFGLPILLGLLVLGLALGTWRERRGKLALALFVVPYVFFLGFGERTSGGYFLGAAPGLILFAALTLERAFAKLGASPLATVTLILAGCGVCASPVFSFLWLTTPERTLLEQRAILRTESVLRLMPEGGTLFTLQFNELTLNGQLPAYTEVTRCGYFRDGIQAGYTQDVMRLGVEQALHNLYNESPALLVDWTWTPAPGHFDDSWWPYLEVIRADLNDQWNVKEFHTEYGTFLSLSKKDLQ